MSFNQIRKKWGKFFLFFMLYFFEGAPMGLIWWTIPAILATQGYSLEVITTLGASATLPWSFKFLLGPVVDRFLYTTRHYSWTICFLQVGMMLGVSSLIAVPLTNPLILWCVVLLSLFSAMQDVVIDAWAIASIAENEKGKANGMMQAGMLTGRWFFGAGLLVALSFISFHFALYILLGLILASILFLFCKFKDLKKISDPPTELTLSSFRFMGTKKYMLLALVALTTGFSLEGFTAVISPYLIDYGFTKEGAGGVLSFTLLFMLFGALIGGQTADKIGDFKAFILSGFAVGLSTLVSGALTQLSSVFFVSSVLMTYIFVGFFTSASYTYYMNKSYGKMEASKFTFLMAATNLCEVIAAFSIGKVITKLNQNYLYGFVFCFIITLMGLFILSKVEQSKNEPRLRTH